jgi:hypothetical protein
VAIAAGEPDLAEAWLSAIRTGEGPVAPHLAARRATELARAAGARKESDDFLRRASAAADAWRGLSDDRAGREAALEELGEAVRIRSLSYGGASASSGAPGTMTLDRLEAYLPLPAEGRLLILKNGAVRYEGR